MAEIAAVISDDRAEPVPPEEMAALVDHHRHLRGGGKAEVASVGTWAHVAHIPGRVVGGIERDGAWWSAAVGTVHAKRPLCHSALSELDGQFAAIRYDGDRDELEVLNDPFGMQALYVARRAGRTYVSTSSMALARHLGATPDPLGTALFLRTGIQFGPVTHWHGIERLEPATVLSFAASGRRSDTYWAPHVDEPVRRMSLSRAVDHCIEMGLETVRQHLSGRPRMWADLTGGFDSRMVTALLAQSGVRFLASTSGEDYDADVRLARDVARAGGYDWQHERLPGDWEPDESDVRMALGWGDGTLEVLQLAEVLWRHEVRSRANQVVVTGAGGEHFNEFPWMAEFLRAGRSRHYNFDNLLKLRVLPVVELGMLRRDPTPEVADYCRRVFTKRTEPYSDEPNTTQLDLIYAYKSVGHFGAYRSAGEAYVGAEMPCYCKDFFTAGFSAHHRWRNGHQLQGGIIERLDPAVAAVLTHRGSPAQRMRLSNAHRFVPYYGGLMRNAVRRIRGRPPPTRPDRQAFGGYRGALRRLRADGILAVGSMRTAELYDKKGLEDFLSRAEGASFNGWSMVGRIATLELALRETDNAAV